MRKILIVVLLLIISVFPFSASTALLEGQLLEVHTASIYCWGDGINDLCQQWSENQMNYSGWFYGSSYSNSNVDVYVYSDLADPTTVADASVFSYIDSSTQTYPTPWGNSYAAWAKEGDTVFFRGVNGRYGAWQIEDIYYDPANPSQGSAIDGTWYFLDDGSADFSVSGQNSRNDVVVDFGFGTGLWARYDDTTWNRLHNLSPESVAVGDLDGDGRDDCIVDFGDSYGIWILYNGTAWSKLHSLSPEIIETGDLDGNGEDEAIIDFGSGVGIYVWSNNTSWTKLHGMSPEIIETGDLDGSGEDEAIIDFGSGTGIWVRYNNTSWAKLHSLSPEIIKTGDLDGNGEDEAIIDFGSGTGIYVRYNNTSWTKLHSLSPEIIETGDLDGSGEDEAIIDFGSGVGIWARYNNTSWTKLHTLSPEIIATGDLDENGKDECITDFGASYGIYARYNDTTWGKLHSLSPESMNTGNFKSSAAASPTIPNAPSSLTATAVSSSEISLSWTDNSDNETGFKIERSLTSGSGFSHIATVGANTTNFSNTGLSSNVPYYYRVRAYNGEGYSGYSNEAGATTLSPVPVPPSSLTATALSSSKIRLSWTDNSDNETGFKIERSLFPDTGFSQIVTVGANTTTYDNSGLPDETTYYYRVRAYNAAGNSAYSNTDDATTGSTTGDSSLIGTWHLYTVDGQTLYPGVWLTWVFNEDTVTVTSDMDCVEVLEYTTSSGLLIGTGVISREGTQCGDDDETGVLGEYSVNEDTLTVFIENEEWDPPSATFVFIR